MSDTRAKNFFIQLKWTFVVKVTSFLTSLWVVNLLYGILGTTNYGIWITVYSIANWVIFFDFGLANGLKNKVAQIVSTNETSSLQKYISSVFTIMLFAAMASVSVLLLSVKVWGSETMLGVKYADQGNLDLTLCLTGVGILVLLTFNNLFNSIFSGFLQNALANLSGMMINIFFCFLLLIKVNVSPDPIFNVALYYFCSMLGSTAVVVLIFHLKHPHLSPPGLNFKDLDVAKEMASVGFKFFVIQTYLVLLTFTDNYLILKYINEKSVTEYSLVFRLFNTSILIFAYFANTLWVYLSDAYHNGDIKWIQQAFKKMHLLIIGFAISLFAVWFFVEDVVRIWVGDETISVSSRLAFLIFLFHVFYMWNFTYSLFLFAVSALKLDFYYSMIAIVCKIVVSVYLLNYLHFGNEAVILASLVCMIPYSILGFLYTNKIIKRRFSTQPINAFE